MFDTYYMNTVIKKMIYDLLIVFVLYTLQRKKNLLLSRILTDEAIISKVLNKLNHKGMFTDLFLNVFGRIITKPSSRFESHCKLSPSLFIHYLRGTAR